MLLPSLRQIPPVSSVTRAHTPVIVLDSSQGAQSQCPLRTGKVLVHLTLATLFVGMAGGISLASIVAPGKEVVLRLVFLMVFTITSLFAYVIRRYGAWKFNFPADILLLVITLSGLPGLSLGSSQDARISLAYFGVLALRNYVLFIALPRSMLVPKTAAWEESLRWILVASVIVMLGSLHTAASLGVSLSSGTRLTGEGNNWMNTNTSGLLVSIGILVVVLDRTLKLWVRLALGALGCYVLILTESRTSLLALAGGILANSFLSLYGGKKFWLLAGIALIGGAMLHKPVLWDKLTETKRIQSIVWRTSGGDRTAGDAFGGRTELIGNALDRLRESPLVGFGYMSEGARIENGYVSILMESGIVGLGGYTVFTLLVGSSSWKLFRRAKSISLRNLGRYTLCITAFLLFHGLGERSHGFQIASMVSNAWLLLGGLVMAYVHLPEPIRHSWGEIK